MVAHVRELLCHRGKESNIRTDSCFDFSHYNTMRLDMVLLTLSSVLVVDAEETNTSDTVANSTDVYSHDSTGSGLMAILQENKVVVLFTAVMALSVYIYLRWSRDMVEWCLAERRPSLIQGQSVTLLQEPQQQQQQEEEGEEDRQPALAAKREEDAARVSAAQGDHMIAVRRYSTAAVLYHWQTHIHGDQGDNVGAVLQRL